MGHWPSVLKGRAVQGLSLSSVWGRGAAAPQGSQGALASSESMSGGREIRAASAWGPGFEVHRPVRPRDTEAFREGDLLLPVYTGPRPRATPWAALTNLLTHAFATETLFPLV